MCYIFQNNNINHIALCHCALLTLIDIVCFFQVHASMILVFCIFSTFLKTLTYFAFYIKRNVSDGVQ